MVYDEKGKIFTQVIPKQPIHVVVQTVHNLIEGSVHARPNQRLKDEINEGRDRFLAVTDATVFDLQKVELFRTSFLLLNLENIIWIIPQDEIIAN
jgi:hypothetical protein